MSARRMTYIGALSALAALTTVGFNMNDEATGGLADVDETGDDDDEAVEIADTPTTEDGDDPLPAGVVDTRTPEQVDAAKAAAAPKPYEPTSQQLNLGWKDVDLRTKMFVTRRQEGTPQVVEGTKTVKEKVKTTEKNEAGEDVEVETVVDKVVPTREVKYVYSDEYEQIGDKYNSLTGALRGQAEIATEFRKTGFRVFEKTKVEFGVWYVEDPDGKQTGYRYSVSYVDRPIAPPKEKKVKEPKPAKEPKAPKDPNAPKATRTRATKAVKNDAPAVQSDAVNVNDMIAEDEE